MNKDNKKKVAGGAAVATAAAGAVVAGAASVLSQDNENVETVTEGSPIAEGEAIYEGENLPELVVDGTAPTLDGGELPEAIIPGHAHTAHSDAQTVHTQVPTAEPEVSETNEVAQQGTSIEDDNQNDVTNIPQEAVEEEEPDAPSFAFDPDEDEEPGLLAQLEEKAEKLGAKIFGDSSETEQSSMSDHMNSMDVTGFN